MTISYYRPPTNPDGSRKSYAQRSAERRQQEREQRAQQERNQVAPDESPTMTYDQRVAMRRAAERGREEGRQLAAIEATAAREAEIAATPPHLRRPENIFTRLIAEWKTKEYRHDIARKIKQYRIQEAEREREIDAEMVEKLHTFQVESNPETRLAREHCSKASAGAETDEERQQWARLRGLVDGGAANSYWAEAQSVLDARLERIQKKIVDQAARQAPLAEEAKALNAALQDTSALQTETETPNDQVTQ